MKIVALGRMPILNDSMEVFDENVLITLSFGVSVILEMFFVGISITTIMIELT
jgi:hypothetical protein